MEIVKIDIEKIDKLCDKSLSLSLDSLKMKLSKWNNKINLEDIGSTRILPIVITGEDVKDFINNETYINDIFDKIIYSLIDLNTSKEILLEKCIFIANEFLDFIWQKLNTGPWKEVPLCYRICFSWTCVALLNFCLRKIRLFINKGKNKTDIFPYFIECIGICDRGLIMGYNISINPLHQIAHDLNYILYTLYEKPHGQIKLIKFIDTTAVVKNEIEVCSKLSVISFMTDFYSKQKPTKLLNICDHWPAMEKWKDFSYFKELAAYRIVPIEIGSRYTEENWSQILITMKDFINYYVLQPSGPVGYLAQHELFNQIPQLKEDIVIPEYCLTGEHPPRLNIWLGPKGTISPLHTDAEHNILVQVIGKKYIRLYEKNQTPFLYPHEDMLLNNTSKIDVEDENSLEKYPLFKNASFVDLILEAGECLYIPPLCWHYVRSLEPSCSVSFWWNI